MKNLILLFALTVLAYTSHAQFSIRRNAVNPAAVDILYKAPVAGQGVRSSMFFEFALQVPDPTGSGLTATFTPGAPLASIQAFDAFTGTDYGNKTFAWAAAGVPNYALSYNFPSTEVVLGQVVFSPAGSATAAAISAIDYQNQTPYGGNSDAAIWTYQVLDQTGPTNQWYDVTNYNALFYQAVQVGNSVGSTAPYTTPDGGVVNQKVSLSNAPLPLTLLSFNASAQADCEVLLKWSTVAEKNFRHFDVEYSYDGGHYASAGIVAAKPQATGGSYDFRHSPAARDQVFYRLKMVDNDNSYSYSKVISVRPSCGQRKVTLFPNPVHDVLSIEGLRDNDEVTVYNTLGQQVLRKVAVGSMMRVDMHALAQGMYSVIVTNGSKRVFSEKIAKD
jgi:hypothetical protein